MKSLIFSFLISLTSYAQDYKPTDNVPWKWRQNNPTKVYNYLMNTVAPECGAIYAYYYPKGKSEMSKDTAVIMHGFCIRENVIGNGLKQIKACEVMKIEWDHGYMEPFYDGKMKLIANGSCDLKNLEKLNNEITRQEKTLNRIDLKLAIISDRINFKSVHKI